MFIWCRSEDLLRYKRGRYTNSDVFRNVFRIRVSKNVRYGRTAQNELTVEETQDEPEIRLAALNGPWDDAPAAEVSYTLAMLDPDAPYRADAIYRSFRHWVVCLLYDFHA